MQYRKYPRLLADRMFLGEIQEQLHGLCPMVRKKDYQSIRTRERGGSWRVQYQMISRVERTDQIG